MKLVWKIATGTVSLVAAVAAWNYVSISHPVASRLSEDSRNSKVSLWAYHQYGLNPSVLVVDLRHVDGEASSADVLRALFQSAESLKEKKFDRVLLAHRGSTKLMMEGDYFQKIGTELKTQNPIFTMRTLPENIHKLDGSAAYGTWTGGLLGVLGKQMEDLNKFSQDWYLRELSEEARR